MKNHILTLICLTSVTMLLGQSKLQYHSTSRLGDVGTMHIKVDLLQKPNNPKTLELYNQAFDSTYGDNIDSISISNGLRIFKQIVNNETNHNCHLYGQSLLTIARIYYSFKEYDSSLIWFEKILNSDVVDTTETNDYINDCYGNYKYYSAMMSSGFYGVQKKNNTKALELINQCESIYKFNDCKFSRTRLIEEKAKTRNFKMLILNSLGKWDEAIALGLKMLIANGNENVYGMIDNTLLRVARTNNINFKAEIDENINSITIVPSDNCYKINLVINKRSIEFELSKQPSDLLLIDKNYILDKIKVLNSYKFFH